jgi:hypothetical protein
VQTSLPWLQAVSAGATNPSMGRVSQKSPASPEEGITNNGGMSMRRSDGTMRVLAASTAVVAVVVFAAAGVSHGATQARASTTAATNALKTTNVWSDNRIVVGVSCVGTEGAVFRLRDRDFYASRFACLVNAFHRPASTSTVLWSQLAQAFRTQNVPLLFQLLRLPSNPTQAQANAAQLRVLGRARPDAVGMQPLTATSWRMLPPPIPARSFNASLRVRHALLQVLPAIEAFYAEHNTYVGATRARLVAAPYNARVPAYVRVVHAAANSYCVEATGVSTVWSTTGPGAAPVLRPCR